MYVIPLTLENLGKIGVLSTPEHLERYVEPTKTGSFYFHTLSSFGDEFVVMSYYKEDIEKAKKRCTEELASHSLKPIWGEIRRESQSWVKAQESLFKAKRALIKDPIRVSG
jgi:hypothetical protein